MEGITGAHQPPSGDEPDEDALPATRGDLRDLRRWLIAAGAWAVAASIIAIIALFAGDEDSGDADRDSRDVANRISRLERTLDKRIEEVEASIADLPTSEDVSKLESRLGKVEDQSSEAAGAAKRAGDTASDLESRVEALEQSQSDDSGGTTTPDSPP